MPTILTPPPVQVFPDFGPYLTFNESIKSATAIRKGIVNIPNSEQYGNMVRLYNAVFVPICAHYGRLPVSSMFRCPALNKAVGGAKNSQHQYGQAMDIDCDGLARVSNRQLFDWIRANLDFDQTITEFPDANGNPGWIHVSYVNKEDNRHQALRAVKQNGVTKYEVI